MTVSGSVFPKARLLRNQLQFPFIRHRVPEQVEKITWNQLMGITSAQ